MLSYTSCSLGSVAKFLRNNMAPTPLFLLRIWLYFLLSAREFVGNWVQLVKENISRAKDENENMDENTSPFLHINSKSCTKLDENMGHLGGGERWEKHP